MKFVIVLCILSVLLLQQIQASPVKVVERQERALARQQASAVNEVSPAAQAADEDDDDDDEDDDDEPDLGDLIEDDDDDDEEDDDDDEDDDDEEDDTPQGQAAPASGADDDDEEDDDDDDYLDRLFDDILSDGDDDEDDDDEDTAASAPNPVAAAPAAPIEDIAPIGQASGISDGVDLPESGNSNEPLASGNAVDNEVIPAGSSNNEGALKNNIIDMSADAFQERNNHFVDAIFARINRIVSDSYDPFVVQLKSLSTVKHEIKSSTTPTHTTATKSQQQQSNKVKTAKPQTTNTSIKKLKNTKSEPRTSTNNDNISNSDESMPKDSKIQNEPKQQNKLQQQLEQLQGQQKKLKATEQIENDVVTNEQQKQQQHTEIHTDEISPETRTVLDNDVKSGNQKKSSAKAHKQNVKKLHNTSIASTTNNHSNNNKQKLKSTVTNNKKANSAHHGTASGKDAMEFLRAEGSLSGLASLKRVGNVKLVTDPEGRNSTIKAKFTLGPLILRVEKSFKRAGVENVKSATARTNEMIGRIKFSVVNDRATLMSIKVQQPKQVEVESKDNHDRTREFVWRRTPKIAKLVNEKLKLAAETLFAPQGIEVVRL